MVWIALAAVIASIIVSGAYVYAPLLRVHAARRFRVQMPAGAVAPGADAVAAPPVELPAKLEALAAAESEPWARDFVRERARQMFGECGSWDQVYAALEQL